MPCDSIILNEVELGTACQNEEVLLKALQEKFGYVDHNLGAVGRPHWFRFNVDGAQVTIDRGTLTSSLSEKRLQEVTGQVKRAYSRQVVNTSAKKFGWSVKWKDETHFEVTKR